MPAGMAPLHRRLTIDPGAFVDYVCAVATAVRPGPLWRPRMRNPTHDAVLALATETYIAERAARGSKERFTQALGRLPP